MYQRDPRSGSGGGVIVQDHGWPTQNPGVKLENRITELAYRQVGRDEMGRALYDESTVGDVVGLMLWAPSTGTTSGSGTGTSVTTDVYPRTIPAWRHAFPVLTIGRLTKLASKAPDLPPDQDIGGGGGGQAVSLYFIVGNEPETTTQNGMTYTLASHTPSKTYTNAVGLLIGAFTYYATGAAVAFTLKAAAASFAAGPKAAGSSPPSIILTVRTSWAQANGASVPQPAAPPGYHFHHSFVAVYGPWTDPVPPGTVFDHNQAFPLLMGFEFWLDGTSETTPDPPPPPPPPPPGGGINVDDGVAGPECEVLPIWREKYQEDRRFKPTKIPLHVRRNDWPSFPTGTQGIVLATMDEDQQVEDFFHTDPRLVVVNVGGGYDCGSILYDTTTKGEYDTERWARLQSAFRILKKPRYQTGYANQGGGNLGLNGALALQFGVSGQGDAIGGFAYDRDVIGKWSQNDGGCMHVGLLVDKHRGGADADGHPINGMHLDAFANFLRDTEHDGPMFFETDWPEPVDDGNFAVKVHMGWDPKQNYNWPRNGGGAYLKGMWRWWMKILVTAETESGLQHNTHPGWTPGVPGDPPIPIGGGGGQNGSAPGTTFGSGGYNMASPAGGNSSVYIGGSTSSSLSAWRRPAVMANELSLPGLLARPQRYRAGEVDIRYVNSGLPEDAVVDYLRLTPATGRLSAWGGQGGQSGGPYIVPGTGGADVGGPWVRTQQIGSSRHRGGTGPGGWLISSPEVGIEDIDTTFAPQGLGISTTYFATAPGAYFGSGTPELASGGLKNGWRWGLSGTSLIFSAMGSTGTATTWVTMDTGGLKLGDAAGQKVGLHGFAAAQSTGWAVSSMGVPRKTLDFASGTLAEVREFLATLAGAQLDKGIIGA